MAYGRAQKVGGYPHRAGFSLVEVLVALVVLSVGMLGIARLFVESLRANKTSIYRTTAVMLAADMAERIRANPLAGVAYAGTGPGTTTNRCRNRPDPCTPTRPPTDDRSWAQAIQNRLPPGSNGAIATTVTPPTTTYTITVSWPETGQVVHSSYVLVMQL